jgi:hypothetical protein
MTKALATGVVRMSRTYTSSAPPVKAVGVVVTVGLAEKVGLSVGDPVEVRVPLAVGLGVGLIVGVALKLGLDVGEPA